MFISFDWILNIEHGTYKDPTINLLWWYWSYRCECSKIDFRHFFLLCMIWWNLFMFDLIFMEWYAHIQFWLYLPRTQFYDIKRNEMNTIRYYSLTYPFSTNYNKEAIYFTMALYCDTDFRRCIIIQLIAEVMTA